MRQYIKCPNCGGMSVFERRCLSCYWTDPEPPVHDMLCMCIECIPTPKDVDPNAEDTDTIKPNTSKAKPPETHHDIGGEAG